MSSSEPTRIDSQPNRDVPPASVQDLLALHDARFVREAYQSVLGRPADPGGFTNYLQQVRAGVPKQQILRELVTSDEGIKAASTLAGLRDLARLPAPRRGLLGRAIERLFARGLQPLHQRLNALENSTQIFNHETLERLNHLQWSLSRLEARLAGSMERLHVRHNGEAASAEAGAAPAAPSAAGPAVPMILEIEYSRTASPLSVGVSTDSRQLALGFRHIEVIEIGSGESLFRLDMREGGNSTTCVLFGFSAPEHWGSWSTGSRSALALWLRRAPRGGLRLRVEASVFDPAFATVDVAVSTSLGHNGHATFLASESQTDLVLESPSGAVPPMFFGSMSPLPDPRNVSLTSATPVVSVIILNYNKPVLSSLSALATAAASIRVPYEILVVDNGSRPDHWATLEQLEMPARRVRIPVNRFFGEGNNIGAEQARGKWLLFLNNDAFPARGCIDELLAAFDDQADCGAACPVFIYPDGRLQEAGAMIREDGSALQRGKADPDFEVSALPRFNAVDYGSAACLLLRAETFRRIGGFNYRYDPAYYEDTDLCFRLALLDQRVYLARDARCTHIENATTADKQNHAGSSGAVELNRQVFLSTWQPYLKSRRPADLPRQTLAQVRIDEPSASGPVTHATFSPFPLTPGGGERYLLATANALSLRGPTVFATADRYSQLRLDNVMFDLGLEVGKVRTAPWASIDQTALQQVVVMGNECLPRMAPVGDRSSFHCQFPFPWRDATSKNIADGIAALKGYRSVIVNSDFTRRAYLEALARHGQTARVDVVFPPVGATHLLQSVGTRKNQILSIGRFTDQGHHKRQDVLIEALKATSAAFRRDWKLVLCGSVPNDAQAKAYFAKLRQSVGDDIQVEFIISPSRKTLDQLLLESAVYAHATGFGVQTADEYWKCEHFGITIVEALAAGCSTYCYGVGGGPEIMRLTGAGSTFDGIEDLAALFEGSHANGLDMAHRQKAAKLFGDEAFAARMATALA